MKVYGPYKGEKGRQIVIFYDPQNRTRKTTSYARYLYIENFGRIPKGYEVDHINGNFLDDRLENLQLLLKNENILKSVKPREICEYICVQCSKKFKRARKTEENNRSQGKFGPFCGKQCAGFYGTEIQNGRVAEWRDARGLKLLT